MIIIDIDKQDQNGTMIFNILDNATELWMTKYIFGETFSSGGATLYKNPSDLTVSDVSNLIKTKRDIFGILNEDIDLEVNIFFVAFIYCSHGEKTSLFRFVILIPTKKFHQQSWG